MVRLEQPPTAFQKTALVLDAAPKYTAITFFLYGQTGHNVGSSGLAVFGGPYESPAMALTLINTSAVFTNGFMHGSAEL